jgi:hypothetical protein
MQECAKVSHAGCKLRIKWLNIIDTTQGRVMHKVYPASFPRIASPTPPVVDTVSSAPFESAVPAKSSK